VRVTVIHAEMTRRTLQNALSATCKAAKSLKNDQGPGAWPSFWSRLSTLHGRIARGKQSTAHHAHHVTTLKYNMKRLSISNRRQRERM
jgi:hypothetical protein